MIPQSSAPIRHALSGLDAVLERIEDRLSAAEARADRLLPLTADLSAGAERLRSARAASAARLVRAERTLARIERHLDLAD